VIEAPIYGNLYGLLHMPNDTPAEGLVRNSTEASTHALAVQRIMRLMLLGLETPEVSEDGDGELLIHLSWYAEAWTKRAIRMSEAERAASQALVSRPHQPEKVTDLMKALKRSLKRHKGDPA
jgi:hypothetical protein